MKGNQQTAAIARGEVLEEHIVKVQRPLATNDHRARSLYLVYAEGRRYQNVQTISSEAKHALGSDFKGYFKATWNGWIWSLGARVTDRGW